MPKLRFFLQPHFELDSLCLLSLFPAGFVSFSLPSFFFFVQLTTLVTVSCRCSLDFQFISFSVRFFFSFAVALKNFINCLLTLYLWLKVSISPSSLAFFKTYLYPVNVFEMEFPLAVCSEIKLRYLAICL